MESEKKGKKGIDYSKGKIYRIVCNTTGLVYIGSTVETLCNRLSKHRQEYKQYLKGISRYVTSFEIIKNNNYNIILIKNYPCNNKEELHREERKYIETIECVNKIIPTRTNKEYYETYKDKILEYHKEYYETNKEYIRENQKEYFETNKEYIKEQQKQYNINNKDKMKEYQKAYRKNNKDKINEEKKEYRKNNKDKIREKQKEYYENNKDKINKKIECEYCKCFTLKQNIKKHQKTNKCLKLRSRT